MIADELALARSHGVRHDAICDGCHDTIFGIRHQCMICPDWNYCNNCIAQAPRKHARHEFAVIHDPQKARDTATVRSQALDFGRLETRFLTIGSLPPSYNSPTKESIRVSCELSIRSLYECPEYIALSYSWGNHNFTRPILLHGRVTWVTTSLEAALQELIARGVNTVWVDALCIDQGNNYEKVYQLRQMGTIFSQAVKVIAWLGPAAEDSENAIEALSKMCEVKDVDCQGPAIMQLLKRQYWGRVWIIQELAKASSVEVWCGTQMLPWDTFIEGVKRWWSISRLRIIDFDHPVFTIKDFCDAERNIKRGSARMMLSAAMVRTLHTKATLRRDRIYALLGITRDGTETVRTPNYVQSNAQVFNSALRHMIVEQSQLNLIFLAGLGREASSISWLPTWDSETPLQARPWIVRCFESPRDVFEKYRDEESVIVCHDNVLEVQGEILGQLRPETNTEVVSGTLGVDEQTPRRLQPETSTADVPISESLEVAVQHLDDVAHQLRTCGNFDGHVAKHPGLFRHDAARVLSAFWSSTANDDRARCPKLRQWFEENAEMMFDDTTLRSIVKEARASQKNLYAPFAEPDALENLDYWSWLEDTEASIALMIRHGFKTQRSTHHKLVVVPVGAEALDVIALVAHCSLPVVLRESSNGRYSVVGEVVNTDLLSSIRDITFGGGLPLLPTMGNRHLRTLHLI
jgi:hypothetical protein